MKQEDKQSNASEEQRFVNFRVLSNPTQSSLKMRAHLGVVVNAFNLSNGR